MNHFLFSSYANRGQKNSKEIQNFHLSSEQLRRRWKSVISFLLRCILWLYPLLTYSNFMLFSLVFPTTRYNLVSFWSKSCLYIFSPWNALIVLSRQLEEHTRQESIAVLSRFVFAGLVKVKGVDGRADGDWGRQVCSWIISRPRRGWHFDIQRATLEACNLWENWSDW